MKHGKIIQINLSCRYTKMSNEEIIWNYLNSELKNPYGAAGLMGNLFAESSLNPILANNIKKHGMTNTEYTTKADEGSVDFANDSIAYGLAQWCYHTRKQALLDFAKETNRSVGDINLQLEYLADEIKKYSDVYKTLCSTKSVKEASDIVLLKYERPANQSDAVKKLRASYGEKYFAKYNVATHITLKKSTASKLKNQLQSG